MSHAEWVRYFRNNPNDIEPGFVPLTKEFSFFGGRFDIFGKDKYGRPTIVEVKPEGEDSRPQLDRYKNWLTYFFQFFGFNDVYVRQITKFFIPGAPPPHSGSLKLEVPLSSGVDVNSVKLNLLIRRVAKKIARKTENRSYFFRDRVVMYFSDWEEGKGIKRWLERKIKQGDYKKGRLRPRRYMKRKNY